MFLPDLSALWGLLDLSAQLAMPSLPNPPVQRVQSGQSGQFHHHCHPNRLGLSAQLDLYPLPNQRVRLDLSARSGLLDPLQLNQHPQDLSDLSGLLPYYPRLPDLLGQ